MPRNSSTSRKFVDLIQKATDKWANWDPPQPIKVGDYGKIDKNSGEFDKKGNIYDDQDIYNGDEEILLLLQNNPPESAARENVFIATSSNVRHAELNLDAHGDVPGLADAAIKGQWTFGSERGALLIMAQPRSSFIPPGKLLGHMARVQALKDMFLVTKVFLCPAYSLYLSSGNNDVVNLALRGSASPTPGVTAGAELGLGWWFQKTTGLFRNGHEVADSFTPLYVLKEYRKPSLFSRRDVEPPKLEGDDLWGDVPPPWDPLDEEGNEDVFEDTVFG